MVEVYLSRDLRVGKALHHDVGELAAQLHEKFPDWELNHGTSIGGGSGFIRISAPTWNDAFAVTDYFSSGAMQAHDAYTGGLWDVGFSVNLPVAKKAES